MSGKIWAYEVTDIENHGSDLLLSLHDGRGPISQHELVLNKKYLKQNLLLRNCVSIEFGGNKPGRDNAKSVWRYGELVYKKNWYQSLLEKLKQLNL